MPVVTSHPCHPYGSLLDHKTGLHGKNYAREMLEHFDDKYLKRFLQKEPEMADEEDIFDLYETILLHQVSFNTIIRIASGR